MTPSRTWAILLATFAAILMLVIVASQVASSRDDAPSVWNRRARGLSAVFAYLKERGVDVRSWESSFETLPPPPGVLVFAAPFSSFFTASDLEAVGDWLAHGGSVILLTSGESPGIPEGLLKESLHLDTVPVPPPPPLAYSAWRDWRGRLMTLRPAEPAPGAGGDGAIVRAGSARATTTPSASLRALLTDDARAPWIFTMNRARGRVLVVNNASLWGNGWIQSPGNLVQVEDALSLLGAQDAPVLFDEWHQGRRAALAAERSEAFGAFEMMIGHIVLVYLLALWTLSRPSGPRLAPAPAAAPPLERSLFALASLHRRAGHAAEASRILVESARLTFPGAADGIAPLSHTAGERDLLALARVIGRNQRQGV